MFCVYISGFSHTGLEILMNRVKSLQPEEIAEKIERCDKDLCTETFLGELKNLLPNPEQVGYLNFHSVDYSTSAYT